MKKVSIILLVILTGSTLFAQESKKEQLNKYLDLAETFGFSGQVLVEKKGEILLNRSLGYTSLDSKKKITSNTLFGIASISKQFTAAAIAYLVQNEILSFQTSLDKLFPNIPEEKKSITVHQLLTHTSGIVSGDLIKDFEPINKQEMIDRILNSKLEEVPGERWMYSNAGYSLLALIVEHVSGMNFEEFLIKNFFDPLDMDHTKVIAGDASWDGLNVAHAINGTNDSGSPKNWLYNMRTIGGGNLASTVEDLYKWNLSLKNNTILHKRITEELFTPHVLIAGNEYYGYGWFILKNKDGGIRLIEHGGDNEKGFNGGFYRYQNEDITLLILNNQFDKSASNLWLRWSVFYPIRDILFERPAGNFSKLELQKETTTDITGVYSNKDSQIFINKQDKRHRLSFKGEKLGYFLFDVPDSMRVKFETVTSKTKKLVNELLRDNTEAFKTALQERAIVWDDFAREWENIITVNGRIIAYEVLATIPNYYNDGVQCFIKFTHEKGTSVISYGWLNNGDGRLYFTNPMDDYQPYRYVAKTKEGNWVIYDLFEDTILELDINDSYLTIGENRLEKEK